MTITGPLCHCGHTWYDRFTDPADGTPPGTCWDCACERYEQEELVR